MDLGTAECTPCSTCKVDRRTKCISGLLGMLRFVMTLTILIPRFYIIQILLIII